MNYVNLSILFFLFFSLNSHALPKCEGKDSTKWNKCYGVLSAEGRTYEGEWRNGKGHGKGSYTFPNGEKYIGEYKEGEVHGKGTLTFPDGEKWVGEFSKDAPWNISWYDKDGKIIAKWSDGVKQ